MKSRNLAKIVTLILSCALLIGAVVGISSLATGSDTIAIEGANVAYEGAVQVVYYVKVESASGYTPYVLVSKSAFEVPKNINNPGDGVTVKTDMGDYDRTTDDGTIKYELFYSNGIAPKELREDVYAVPVLADENGEIKVVGNKWKYSPYTYAMNRFDDDTTPAQVELYKALLNYGAAVQAVLDKNAGSDGYLWADEYYFATVDGGETVSFRGNTLATNPAVVTADRFIEDGDKSFTGWTDDEGNTVVGWTTLNLKPGNNVLTRVYEKTHDDLITFDGATELPEGAVFTPDEDSTDSYANVGNGVVAFGKNAVLADGSTLKFASINPGVYAREYVFEGDFNWESYNGTMNQWLFKFALFSGAKPLGEMANFAPSRISTTQYNAGGVTCNFGTWHHFKVVVKVADDGALSAIVTIDGLTGSTNLQYAITGNPNKEGKLTNAQDYRMISAGIEMRNSGSTYHNATQGNLLLDNLVVYSTGEAASYDVAFDANGGADVAPYPVTMGAEYTLPTPENGDNHFLGWYIGDTRVADSGTWDYIGTSNYGKAPTLTAKWTPPINVALDPNGGTVSSTTATVYAGQAYTLPTPERAGLIFGGWYDAEGNFYAAKGTSWAGETDITLTARWYLETAGLRNDFENGSTGVGSKGSIVNGAWSITTSGWNPSTYFAIKSDASAVTGNTDGTKYVFEADFTYVGGASNTKDQHSAFIGFTVKGGFGNNGNMISSNDWIQGNGVNTEEGDAAAVVMYGQTHEKGETYRIRYEYVVGEGQYINVYVNGEYKTQHQLANNKNLANVSAVYGFDFVWRGAGGTFIFDNTYCGIESVAQESSFTLDANYGILPEGAKTEWTLATGESYTLPTPILDGFTFAGWSCGDIAIATSGKWAASLGENAVLTANWKTTSAHSTDFSDGKLPSWITGGGLTVENGALQAAYDSKGIQFKPVETVAGASVGTKYIFEMDFTFHGIDTADDNNLAFIGFSHTNATWQSGTHKWAYLGANNVGDTVYFYGNAAKKDEAVTLRFEFTVTGASTGDLEVYVNGMAGSNTTGGVIKELNTGDFHQFNIQWRGAANNRNLSATIDNVTVAVEYPVVEGTVTLDPNGGILPEGAVDSFTVMNGMKLPELPTPNGGAYAFAGWYNGATLIKGGDTWLGGTATLVAKYLDITTKTVADATIAKTTTWTRTSDTTALNAGDKVVFSTTYTYKGLTGFTVAGGVITPNSGSESGDSRNFGFPRFYDGDTGVFGGGDTVKPSGNYVKADGTVVAYEDGKLLEGYTDLKADQIFYQKLTWGSMTFEINKTYTIVYTFTINGNGSITADVAATDADGNVDTGAATKWKNGNNITKFTFEYRGSSYVGTYTNTQEFKNTKFEVIKPLDGTFVINTKADASGNKKDPNITVPNYNVNNVDVAGQVFTIQTKYTFLGLGGVFTIDPETFKVTDCYVDNATIAYMGFYNNNAIGDRLRYASAKLPSTAKIVNAKGEVVVDADGILLEEYRDLTADDLFYSQVTWAGITFDIGVEYDLFMSYTTGATTYANGVITAEYGTVKITATCEGVTQTGSMDSTLSATDGDFAHNVQGFSFYCRGDKNMTGSADIAYTFYHSFKDIVTTLYTPDVDLGIADDAKVYGVALHKYNNTTSVKFVSVVEGVAYTLADPAAIDGYTFEGWYVCDTKGNITGEEVIPSTGDAWPFSANVRLAAKWVAVEAGE